MNRIRPIQIFCLMAVGMLWMAARQPVSNTVQNHSIKTDTLRGLDPETGFVIAQGLDLMRAHCTGCHSANLITQYRATREVWLEKIRWMQKTQNLWELGEAEPKILDYLAKHYGPVQTFDRRQPLKTTEWYSLPKGN